MRELVCEVQHHFHPEFPQFLAFFDDGRDDFLAHRAGRVDFQFLVQKVDERRVSPEGKTDRELWRWKLAVLFFFARSSELNYLVSRIFQNGDAAKMPLVENHFLKSDELAFRAFLPILAEQKALGYWQVGDLGGFSLRIFVNIFDSVWPSDNFR